MPQEAVRTRKPAQQKPLVEAAAIVTIKRGSAMTPKGRHAIALWLRRTAADLERNGDKMASLYRARYLCPKKRS